MTSNQRIDEFLRLQDKGISLDEIASTLGVKPQTLRRNLNKNGYKSVNGKYLKDDKKSTNTSVQVSFGDNTLIEDINNKKIKQKSDLKKLDKVTQKTTRKKK